jgi:hypothetical protein
MLVLCSRNARPEKGLVRRPHLDQHECPLPGDINEVLSMRAGKDHLAIPLRAKWQKSAAVPAVLLLVSLIDTC